MTAPPETQTYLGYPGHRKKITVQDGKSLNQTAFCTINMPNHIPVHKWDHQASLIHLLHIFGDTGENQYNNGEKWQAVRYSSFVNSPTVDEQ